MKRLFSSAVICQHIPAEGLVLDLTCGLGQYSKSVLTHTNCKVLGIDCDSSLIPIFNDLQSEFGLDRFCGEIGLASNASHVMKRRGFGPKVDVVMVDLGVNENQAKDPNRGLDVRLPGLLDCRYSREDDRLSMAEIINSIEMDDLTAILKSYGGVIQAKDISTEILESRYLLQDIYTTKQLMDLLTRVHEKNADFWAEKDEKASNQNINRAFLALRRFVNDEINELVSVIKLSEVALCQGGVLIFTVFSEFEVNLIQKTVFRKLSGLSQSEIPTEEPEIRRNWKTVLNLKENDGRAVLIFEKC